MWLPAPRSGVPNGSRVHPDLYYGGIGLHCEWGRRRVEATLNRHLDPRGRDAFQIRELWDVADI
eukprot:468794-Alexandrium_andersonii.AAC.1